MPAFERREEAGKERENDALRCTRRDVARGAPRDQVSREAVGCHETYL